MTVPAQVPVSGPHLANGTNRNWSFTFKVRNPTEMGLQITHADGSYEEVFSGFTIADAYLDNPAGGVIVYPIAPADALETDAEVVPFRAAPYSQPTRIGNLGGYFPETHESALDWLAYQIQQIADEAARSVKIRRLNGLGPTLLATDGQFLKIDGSSNTIIGVDQIMELTPGAGTLRYYTPYDFEATGLGYPNNDHDAFEDMYAAAAISGYDCIIPQPVGGSAGHWFIKGSLTIPSNVRVIGIGHPKIVAMNNGGRGVFYVPPGASNVYISNIDLTLHGNLAKAAATDYTAGAAGVWIGDVYSPTNTPADLELCENVVVEHMTIRSGQVNPEGGTNAFAIHGIAIWGNTRRVITRNIDIRGRYIGYFWHADWGTRQPRITPVTGVIVPYSYIWHPRELRLEDIHIEGDYTWLAGTGNPATVNGISFSNAQQVSGERIYIKNVAEGLWFKIGDGGSAPSVPNTDVPLETELNTFHFKGVYIENSYGFAIQISNKSYTHNVTGVETFGTDVDGTSYRFEAVTIVRGPNENAKGALLFSAYWCANVIADFNIVHPPGVTTPGIGAPIRVFNAKNVRLSGNWTTIGRAVDVRGCINCVISAKMINPAQERDAAYAWADSTTGVNLYAKRSLAADGASTTLAANYVPAPVDFPTPDEIAASKLLSLTAVPWALDDNDTLFVGNVPFFVTGIWPVSGAPTVITVDPNPVACTAGATVYKDRASTAAANALAGDTSISVQRVPFPIVGGAYIYTGTQVIETVDTVTASNGTVTINVKKLEANITLGDSLIFDGTVRDVTIEKSHIQGYRIGVNLEGAADSTPENIHIKNNVFHRNGLYDIYVEGAASAEIDGNSFTKCNRSLNASTASNIRVAATPAQIAIRNNSFERLFDPKVRFNVYLNTLAAGIEIAGNEFNGYDPTLVTPACIFSPSATLGAQPPLIGNNRFAAGLTRVLPAGVPLSFNIGQNRVIFASAAPTTGSYTAGDIAFNLTGTGGWRCTASGSPGTWVADVPPALASAFMQTMLDDVDAPTARATLGLGSIATQAASAVAITGGTITGITDLAIADGGTGASTEGAAWDNLTATTTAVASAATMNLGAAATFKLSLTGTTNVTSFGTTANKVRLCQLAAGASFRVTAGANIILPGGAGYIQMLAGDWFLAASDGSGVWTILHYQPATARSVGRNAILNGGFDIWQRGTTFALASGVVTWLADLWKCRMAATGRTASRVTGILGGQYGLRMQRDSGNASTSALALSHQIDSARSIALAGKWVIVSFDYETGANWSPTVALTVNFHTGTGVDEAFDIASATFPTGPANTRVDTGAVLAAGQTPTRYFCIPFQVPANASEIAIRLTWSPVGTAGADDWITFDNFKLEPGQVSTPFEKLPLAETMDHCRRQFEKTFLQATAPAQNVGVNTGERIAAATIAGAVAGTMGSLVFGTVKRASPTMTLFNPAAANAQVRNLTDGADMTASAAANISDSGFEVTYTGTAGTAVGERTAIHFTADSSL